MRAMLIALACDNFDCSWRNWTECVREFFCRAFDIFVSPIFALFYDVVGWMVAKCVELIISAVGTMWVYVPTLHPTAGDDYAPVSTVSFMRSQTLWLLGSVAMVSIIIAGLRMAWYARAEPARDLVKSLATLIVVSTCGLAFVTVLTQIGDALATSFIEEAVRRSGKSFADAVTAMVAGPMIASGGALTLPIIITMGFTAFLVSVFQIMLMIVRNGMLILLAGVLPLAAAATNTEMGKSWFRKICGWLVAFIVYKPIAALIYATGIMLGGSQSGLMTVITGVMMMVLSIVALPALLRLVSPPGG